MRNNKVGEAEAKANKTVLTQLKACIGYYGIN